LIADAFEPYPGYSGNLTVEGTVNISGSSFGIQVVTYHLSGVDVECGRGNTTQPNTCGIHVHRGSTCGDAQGHFWDNTSISSDPWSLGPTYLTLFAEASGKSQVATGLDLKDLGGKVIVVHDFNGGRVACSTLRPDGASSVAFWHDGGCYAEKDWRKQEWLNFTGAFRRCGPSSVCLAQHEMCTANCFQDEQCEMFPMRICDSKVWKCRHKALFGNAAGSDVAAAIIFFLISGLALSAGIGGGGLYVPLLMLILGFQVHEATAVSQACLAGGASSALIYNLRQRHPNGHKPMIDYDLVLIMGPNLLLGAMVGSVMNFALPSWLILILLIVILVHSAFKTFKKAIQTLRKERQGHVGPGAEDRLSKNPIERCLRLFGLGKRYTEFANSSKATPATLGRTVDTGDVKLELDLASDQGFLLMWIIVVVSILLRGGRASPGLVPMCSEPYWIIAAVTAIILVLLSVCASCGAAAEGVQPEDGALQWTLKTAIYVSMWSLLAGTLAALCGIGGGMIMGPKLLELGCLPQVQSATTATTLFVMSTSTAISFWIQGTAALDYSLWLAFATALGAVVGKAMVGWLVKRLQRPSVIMFLLGGIIFLSVVVMAITGRCVSSSFPNESNGLRMRPWLFVFF